MPEALLATARSRGGESEAGAGCVAPFLFIFVLKLLCHSIMQCPPLSREFHHKYFLFGYANHLWSSITYMFKSN